MDGVDSLKTNRDLDIGIVYSIFGTDMNIGIIHPPVLPQFSPSSLHVKTPCLSIDCWMRCPALFTFTFQVFSSFCTSNFASTPSLQTHNVGSCELVCFLSGSAELVLVRVLNSDMAQSRSAACGYSSKVSRCLEPEYYMLTRSCLGTIGCQWKST